MSVCVCVFFSFVLFSKLNRMREEEENLEEEDEEETK